MKTSPRSLPVAVVATIAFAIALAQSADAFQSDGKLPMYPKATLNAKMGDMPAGAIAQGVPLVLETAESVKTVDAWYGANTRGACSRLERGGRVQYTCAGGSIVIYVHGGTEIALVPSMGAFHL